MYFITLFFITYIVLIDTYIYKKIEEKFHVVIIFGALNKSIERQTFIISKRQIVWAKCTGKAKYNNTFKKTY